jgi:hypothetical protein
MGTSTDHVAGLTWAAGWIPRDHGCPLGFRPVAGRLLPVPGAVWATGYRDDELRTAVDGEVSLSVVGVCLAADEELQRATAAARAGRWGELAGWGGSYVSVISRPGEIIVLGDLAGSARVYYAGTPEGHVWTTAATPLAAFLGAGRRLEPLALDMAVHGLELYGGEVPYEGVTAVPPGHALRIRQGRARLERWHAHPAGLQEPEFAETATIFRELMLDAVARRVRRVPAGGRLTGDLSGGADSGALMCLAARLAGVTGLTYADFESAEADAARIASQVPGLSHEIIARDTATLHYRGIGHPGELPATDLPSGDLPVLGPDRAILDRAAALGSSDHLIGVGGDELLSARPSALCTLLRSGHRMRAFRGAVALSRRDRIPVRRTALALRLLARATYPDALRAAAMAIGSGTADAIVEPGDWQYLAWATPTAAAGWLSLGGRAAVSGRLLELADAGAWYPTPEAREDWQEIRRGASDIQGYRALARSRGITVHTPFYDRPLLRLLDLPGHARELPPRFKALVTAGLRGHLPPAVAGLIRKDDNNVLFTDQDGLRASAPALRALIASSALAEAGLIDRAALRAYADRAVAGVDTRHASLVRWAAAEVWLRDTDTRRVTWWEAR